MQAIASGLCTASTHWGLGTELMTLMLEPTRVQNMLKFAMISMPFGVVGPMLGRISFILFLQNTVLTVHTLRRKILWWVIGLQVVINLIPIVLQFTQCKPVAALWDPYQIQTACRDAVVVMRYGFFQGAFNALTDLGLIVIALLVTVHLKLRLQTKIALCAILSLSSLAMIATILKTIQLQLMNSTQFSYAYAMWTIWFLTEGTVIIVTASVPRLRPLVILRKKPTSSRAVYNNTYSNELDASSRSRGRSRGHRYGTSVSIYAERSKDSAPSYPTPVLMRWNNDSGSDSQDLIALEEQISASRSMQKFIHS
ncbi:hypothetical protein BJX64DRAFT_17821 [Aspergillus heterothallicus]